MVVASLSMNGEGLRQRRAAEIRAALQARRQQTPMMGGSDLNELSQVEANEAPEIEETATETQSVGPVGSGERVVKEGECISSIAMDTGHFCDTIWDDPANAELRETRKDPNVLLPGDRVHVPELRKKDDTGQTEMRHRFVRKGWPEMLRIRVLLDGEPRGNEPYTIEIDGSTFEGMTDADGKLSCPIVPNARRANLRVGVEPDVSRYTFTLGAMDPIEHIRGVQGRLINLGFDCGAIDGICGPKTEAALREYQKSRKLPVTGEPDETTRKQLQADFGC